MEAVFAFGGDVFRFAGDAMFCVFPVFRKDLLDSIERACNCGISLISSVEGFEEIVPGIKIGLRVGIGMGELLCTAIGGVGDRWEFILFGEVVDQFVNAEREADIGEAILSPEVARFITEYYPQRITQTFHFSTFKGKFKSEIFAKIQPNEKKKFIKIIQE
eukprot:TRINITY_DN21938_c0_g1_i1.p1 TRINITY_DN21938_c0_g1~~TRINITY_DN21938_c0_g1_i1.p1  ORF type:complete len:161 (-),score=36.98 TRINITY_DN21938_c0_g1_i1:589-1071(-)